jgi:hypothetical protein
VWILFSTYWCPWLLRPTGSDLCVCATSNDLGALLWWWDGAAGESCCALRCGCREGDNYMAVAERRSGSIRATFGWGQRLWWWGTGRVADLPTWLAASTKAHHVLWLAHVINVVHSLATFTHERIYTKTVNLVEMWHTKSYQTISMVLFFSIAIFDYFLLCFIFHAKPSQMCCFLGRLLPYFLSSSRLRQISAVTTDMDSPRSLLLCFLHMCYGGIDRLWQFSGHWKATRKC